MAKTFTVYIHRNKLNNKCYIGITSTSVETRWKNGIGYLQKHKDGTYKQNKFANAIIKYGWDNFEHIIWGENLSNEDACKLERMLIGIWETVDKGYNTAYGGETVMNNRKHTIEAKKKMSEALKGKKPSEETRKKMSQSRRGSKNGNFGKRGAETSMYGKHHSKETISKIRENQRSKRKVVCVETGVVYLSIMEAERITGIRNSDICRVLSGIRRTCGGYHWEYANE